MYWGQCAMVPVWQNLCRIWDTSWWNKYSWRNCTSPKRAFVKAEMDCSLSEQLISSWNLHINRRYIAFLLKVSCSWCFRSTAASGHLFHHFSPMICWNCAKDSCNSGTTQLANSGPPEPGSPFTGKWTLAWFAYSVNGNGPFSKQRVEQMSRNREYYKMSHWKMQPVSAGTMYILIYVKRTLYHITAFYQL